MKTVNDVQASAYRPTHTVVTKERFENAGIHVDVTENGDVTFSLICGEKGINLSALGYLIYEELYDNTPCKEKAERLTNAAISAIEKSILFDRLETLLK